MTPCTHVFTSCGNPPGMSDTHPAWDALVVAPANAPDPALVEFVENRARSEANGGRGSSSGFPGCPPTLLISTTPAPGVSRYGRSFASTNGEVGSTVTLDEAALSSWLDVHSGELNPNVTLFPSVFSASVHPFTHTVGYACAAAAGATQYVPLGVPHAASAAQDTAGKELSHPAGWPDSSTGQGVHPAARKAQRRGTSREKREQPRRAPHCGRAAVVERRAGTRVTAGRECNLHGVASESMPSVLFQPDNGYERKNSLGVHERKIVEIQSPRACNDIKHAYSVKLCTVRLFFLLSLSLSCNAFIFWRLQCFQTTNLTCGVVASHD